MKARKLVSLPTSLNTQLNSYTESAKASANPCGYMVGATVSAIALGSLMLIPMAHAEIVYTPANRSVGGDSRMPIDLNNDGIADLSISAYNFVSFSSGDHEFHDLRAIGVQGNQILDTSGNLAIAGVQGQLVGPPMTAKARFGSVGLMASTSFNGGVGGTTSSSRGLWNSVKNRYLGIKFTINGETHYGWARMNAQPGFATLTGYAYETIPDKPIPAGVLETPPGQDANGEPQALGSPSSLGALARGKTAFSH